MFRFLLISLVVNLLGCGGGDGFKLYGVFNGLYGGDSSVIIARSSKSEVCAQLLANFSDRRLEFIKDSIFIGAGGGNTAHGLFYSPAAGHVNYSVYAVPGEEDSRYNLDESWTFGIGQSGEILAEREGEVRFLESELMAYSGTLTLTRSEGADKVLCHYHEDAEMSRVGDAPGREST